MTAQKDIVSTRTEPASAVLSKLLPELYRVGGSNLDEAISQSLHIAIVNHQVALTLEHFVWGVLTTQVGAVALMESGTSIVLLKNALIRHFSTGLPKVAEEVRSELSFRTLGVSENACTVIQSLVTRGRMKSRHMTPADMLLAVVSMDDAETNALLLKAGLVPTMLKRFILEVLPVLISQFGENLEKLDVEARYLSKVPKKARAKQNTAFQTRPIETKSLKALQTELTRPDKIANTQSRCVNRTKELKKIGCILRRRHQNNPLLVGEAGVGKTSLITEFARRLVEDPESIGLRSGLILQQLHLEELISGILHRTDTRTQLKVLLQAAQQDSNIILFIDDLHLLFSSKLSGRENTELISLLRPIFQEGEVRCICTTTLKKYTKHFLNDVDCFPRCFQKVVVPELNEKQALQALKCVQELYEKFHNVQYTPEALQKIIDTTREYVPAERFPAKAIDLLDGCGACVTKGDTQTVIVTPADVTYLVSARLDFPIDHTTHLADKEVLDLREHITTRVFGQDDAVESVLSAVIRAKSDLAPAQKPLGSFLFSGPTGVGKTELAKQLAEGLGLKLIRFDMSEYLEKHSIARLIGAPPGYTGFEQKGLLTSAIQQHPRSVVLFDEVEKAHPSVLNALLQILDEGTLTDSHGDVGLFDKSYVILTTNAGAPTKTIGFTESDDLLPVSDAELLQSFSREFLNRLDEIVAFSSLPKEVLSKIVNKEITDLTVRLQHKNLTVTIDDASRDTLLTSKRIKLFGAREIKRIFEKNIIKSISECLVFQKPEMYSVLQIHLDETLQITTEILRDKKNLNTKVSDIDTSKLSEEVSKILEEDD